MNIRALKRAARIEYAVLRLPLDVVDHRVVQRYLDEHSPARQSFERALRTLDEVVAQWLDDPAERASDVDASPVDDTDDPVDDTDAADAGTHDGDPADLSADEVTQIDTLTDELVEEQKTETFAGELAEDDELRRVQAELQAKRLVEEQDEQR